MRGTASAMQALLNNNIIRHATGHAWWQVSPLVLFTALRPSRHNNIMHCPAWHRYAGRGAWWYYACSPAWVLILILLLIIPSRACDRADIALAYCAHGHLLVVPCIWPLCLLARIIVIIFAIILRMKIVSLSMVISNCFTHALRARNFILARHSGIMHCPSR